MDSVKRVMGQNILFRISAVDWIATSGRFQNSTVS